MKKNRFLPIILIMLAGCSSSPTGRNQITIFSESELAQIGRQSFDEIKQKEKLSDNPALIEFVQCVSDNITRNVDSSVHQGIWEVVVFESKQANAFALPGGKIGVYTGLLKITENQHQLAAVIGHEVGHVIARHANERMSSGMLAQGGLIVADAVMESQKVSKASRQEWGEYLGVGLQYGVLMPYSRTHESEADIIGQELMARSGFYPEASVELWQNMAKQKGGGPPELLSTHPSSSSRIRDLKAHLPVSQALLEQQTHKPNCVRPRMVQ